MKIVFILTMLILLGMVSAETIQFGNYTATFDMKQPHIIENNKLRTYYGLIVLTPIYPPNYLQIEHLVGVFEGNHISYQLYVYNDSYFALPLHQDGIIYSTMNLTSTLDFLKTLKIERKAA